MLPTDAGSAACAPSWRWRRVARVGARHQALHHFVAQSDWSDAQVLRRVVQWVVPRMDGSGGGYWIVDDTAFPKKGGHSVEMARQYCGVLGNQDNCQVAVSVSLANAQASVPVAWRLYLPRQWAEDGGRAGAGPRCPRTLALRPRPRLR
jgi:SRSO17 transposase